MGLDAAQVIAAGERIVGNVRRRKVNLSSHNIRVAR